VPDRTREPPGPVEILAPTGRDAEGAQRLLSREGLTCRIHPTLRSLSDALGDASGMALVASEALVGDALAAVSARIADQPPWSDLPFIVLTQPGVAARRLMAELTVTRTLGNVLFLERPLNALSLSSAVRSALRARQRQREVRSYLAQQVDAAERAAALLEARVQERTAALEAAEAERRKMAEALAQSQKMEAVGQLTGGLAHDFNNMLAGTLGSLDLLRTRLNQGRIDQLHRYIAMAMQGVQRAATLTQRLLAFSRRQALDPRPVAIETLVAGMLELIRSTVGPGIGIRTEYDPELWQTLCDPHQLENALLNLCINARDAMPDGGSLTISASNVTLSAREAATLSEARPGDYAVLSVTDTGHGMTPAVIARAFDPFFTTKPLGQGTGLGLSMIYGFVQQSGGHVQISSAPGRGTTVRLFLPRSKVAAESAPAREPTKDTAADAHGTVLIVDDEEVVRDLVREALEDQGFGVRSAPDGSKGLEILRSAARIDLLVTDVGMPGGMNGRQLADAARAQRPDLKVLFITGYADVAASRDGLASAGMQVMAKPFAVAELAERVRTILGR
jgi:signal transduction histidine kinase